MKHTKPILPVICVLLVGVSLACNFSFSLKDPTPTPTFTAVPPTNTPIPPPPTLAPTVPPVVATEPPQVGVLNPDASSSGDIYYSETFDNLDNWSHFVLKGDEVDTNYEVFDNRFRSEINAQDTWLYHIFEGGEFTDVRIDVQVENRASNTNYVAILCRYTDESWYEVNILNTGEFFVFYVVSESGGYGVYTMYGGGSTLILTGQKINNYAVLCQGEQLSVLINGEKAVTIPLKTGDFRFLPEGKVGLSVATSYAIPVIVDFLQFNLSVP